MLNVSIDDRWIVVISDGDTPIVRLGYHGGTFDYNGATYILLTPYHGYETVQLRRLAHVTFAVQQVKAHDDIERVIWGNTL